MSDKKRYTKWKCPECEDEVISDRLKKWSMDTCKCGKSSVDIDEHYVRVIGEIPIVIEESDDLETLK